MNIHRHADIHIFDDKQTDAIPNENFLYTLVYSSKACISLVGVFPHMPVEKY